VLRGEDHGPPRSTSRRRHRTSPRGKMEHRFIFARPRRLRHDRAASPRSRRPGRAGDARGIAEL
jgi:hypothetical protein